MTPEQFAAILDGREYQSEITRDEEATAKRHGLVVVFGASDDLCELRGAIDDEVGCCGGSKLLIDAKGVVPARGSIDPERMSDDEIREILDRRRDAVTIEVEWHDYWDGGPGPNWTYKAPFPHATFEIHDDDGPYCRGIVFAIAEIGGGKPTTTTLSLNSIVRVRLTEAGVKRNQDYYRRYMLHKFDELYPSVAPGADGTLQTELWHLMEVFGPVMTIGSGPSWFGMDIEVVE